MYIAFESIAGNDPRWLEDFQRVQQFWIYTVVKIDDDKITEKNISDINAVILNDNEGKYSIFSSIANGKITVKANTPQSELVYDNETGHPEEEKTYYTPTSEEISYITSFLKKVLKNYAENHLDNAEERNNFFSLVDACADVDACNWLMYHYLDITSYNTFGDKQPQFSFHWK